MAVKPNFILSYIHEAELNFFCKDYYGSHGYWALKLVLSDFLNLINIIFNIFIIQW
jgi:hypothetical protein